MKFLLNFAAVFLGVTLAIFLTDFTKWVLVEKERYARSALHDEIYLRELEWKNLSGTTDDVSKQYDKVLDTDKELIAAFKKMPFWSEITKDEMDAFQVAQGDAARKDEVVKSLSNN